MVEKTFMTNDPNKYISLKEAAKISGYSADYVGQLIRGGKIEGKQVFSNVAWMTTEDAIQKYLRRQSEPAGSKKWLQVFLDKMLKSISITSAYTVVNWAASVLLGLFIVFLISVIAIAIDHKVERGYVQQLEHADQ
jgi:hypothetical protein